MTPSVFILAGALAAGPGFEHLATLETVEILDADNEPGPAQQGIAAFGDSFYTSSGWFQPLFPDNNELTAYDSAWGLVGGSGVFGAALPPHFGDIAASAGSIYVPMSHFGSPDGPGPFSIGEFDRLTLAHVGSFSLAELDRLYGFEDAAGIALAQGDLFLVDYRDVSAANTRIIRIDLDMLQEVESFEIETRKANGLAFWCNYVYVTSDRDSDLGEIHVYDYDALSPVGVNAPLQPMYTYEVDGDLLKFFEHAEGLTFRGTELWVCVANGTKVRRIETPALPAVTGDVNGDGAVDILDLLDLLAAWGVCPGCPADLDGDGVVGINDLLALLANWGAC